ncbi:hypothetical protein L208DRAFT_1128578, partial [Tricholoma matsutake]
DVCVVDKAYLSKSFKSREWQATIDDILHRFQLNKEQDCAFCIVANHASSPDSDQLKLYIGGMAGIGKSQLWPYPCNAFFIPLSCLKNESHLLITIAPTGSAAELLGGSTYHSAFGINTDGLQSSGTQLSQMKSKLAGVEYVFIDEVSMLSCRDMYLISEQL